MKKVAFFVLFSCFVGVVCLAQSSEDITITTYYPSPDGVYETLTTDVLTVNDTATIDILNVTDIDADSIVTDSITTNTLTIAGGAFRFEVDGGNLNISGGDVYFVDGSGNPSTIYAGGVLYCVSY